MNFKLQDLASFDRMITPVIIKILFWVGVVISVLGGIGYFFAGIVGGIMNSSFGQVLGGLIGGPLVMIIGVLITRVYAELLIIFFQINESLTDIKTMLKKDE